MGRRNAANNTEISQSCRSTACIAAVLVPTRLGTFRGANLYRANLPVWLSAGEAKKRGAVL